MRFRFDCEPGSAESGWTFSEAEFPVPESPESVSLETGSRKAGSFPARAAAPEPGGPFRFSLPLPEGSYRVRICFGDARSESSTRVFSQGRRLMLGEVLTGPGKFAEAAIAVNLRTARLMPPLPTAPGADCVVLKDSEKTGRDWADRLSLLFSGPHPCVSALEIEAADELPVIYLAGDSTVADQESPPYASWGQMLPAFFGPGVVVANHAESGETLKSFISGLRLAKVLERMKPGDYLFIQFGHNDQKAEWPQTYLKAETTYRAYLTVYIAEARLRGATPVLITSCERARFGTDGKIIPSHGRYPDAVRALAAEERVALIDLEKMSRDFYESMGPDLAPRAFAMPGDYTHHNEFGAMELAACVASAVRNSGLPLAVHIRKLRNFRDQVIGIQTDLRH